MQGTSGATAVEVAGLIKEFGRFRALDGLDLAVEPGEVHGFLGPNGAGKSTTIRVLLGLLRADGGRIRLFGGDPWHDAVALHRRLAYVPGDVALWPNLTGGEAVDVLAAVRGGLDGRRRSALLERFELDPTKKTRTYSKGNRQKVALVAALASDAELLILDEPTSGLDPLMEAVFQECVAEITAEGRTVLLSSHLLAEVEALCDRVSIIRAGRTVQTGTLDDLRHLTHTTVDARTRAPATAIGDLPGVHNVTTGMPGGVTSTTGTDATATTTHESPGTDAGHHVRFDVDGDHLDAAMRTLAGFGITALTSSPPSLEELFLRHYGNHDDSNHDDGNHDDSAHGTRTGEPADRGPAVDTPAADAPTIGTAPESTYR
ncbi:ABC transporter ATP-binding protein [Prauserella halophila]|uniref:ABC transporter ATP-binding protein n=1 Tax=Prauserella halophila TaxID=185641 RepID=A0ABN1WNH9_9PSEU|nr:ABC transporter ATP-binding protein [Prauserella halophila]MCP2237687.1 ABC-2 type transport system ATP-binding protein [Prauserella halophila]